MLPKELKLSKGSQVVADIIVIIIMLLFFYVAASFFEYIAEVKQIEDADNILLFVILIPALIIGSLIGKLCVSKYVAPYLKHEE